MPLANCTKQERARVVIIHVLEDDEVTRSQRAAAKDESTKLWSRGELLNGALHALRRKPSHEYEGLDVLQKIVVLEDVRLPITTRP